MGSVVDIFQFIFNLHEERLPLLCEERCLILTLNFLPKEALSAENFCRNNFKYFLWKVYSNKCKFQVTEGVFGLDLTCRKKCQKQCRSMTCFVVGTWSLFLFFSTFNVALTPYASRIWKCSKKETKRSGFNPLFSANTIWLFPRPSACFSPFEPFLTYIFLKLLSIKKISGLSVNLLWLCTVLEPSPSIRVEDETDAMMVDELRVTIAAP